MCNTSLAIVGERFFNLQYKSQKLCNEHKEEYNIIM